MAEVLGTGICAHDSVPIAIYCALRHPGHFDRTIHEAVFAGGDTDTIASMAGAVAGALAGQQAIPQRWIEAVRDDRYSTSEIEAVADRLWAAR